MLVQIFIEDKNSDSEQIIIKNSDDNKLVIIEIQGREALVSVDELKMALKKIALHY